MPSGMEGAPLFPFRLPELSASVVRITTAMLVAFSTVERAPFNAGGLAGQRFVVRQAEAAYVTQRTERIQSSAPKQTGTTIHLVPSERWVRHE